jgi:hypothetical protein
MPEQTYHLLVVLKQDLTPFVVRGELDEQLTVGGTTFMDTGYGDFTGFYDWLRNSKGQILGVRYYPFEDIHFLFDIVGTLNYIDASRNREVFNIYFSDDRVFDESVSDDQAFGGNKVYQSWSGEYAVSFAATDMVDFLSLSLPPL